MFIYTIGDIIGWSVFAFVLVGYIVSGAWRQ